MLEFGKLCENLFLQYSFKMGAPVVEIKAVEAILATDNICLHRPLKSQKQLNCYSNLYVLHNWRQERHSWEQSWRMSLNTA